MNNGSELQSRQGEREKKSTKIIEGMNKNH